MRIVRRVFHALVLVLMLLVGATAAVVIVSQTSWFKDWLRAYIEREAGLYLNGSLSIDRLDGNLFFGVELENVGVSMDGSQVIAIEDAGVDYSIFELVSKGLSLDNIRLNKPVLHLRRDGDTWSISRLIKKQEQEADRRGPSRPVSIEEVRITDGSVIVEGPVGTSGVDVPSRFDHLDAELSLNYEPVRYSIGISQVSFRGSNPALALNALSGDVSIREDTLHIDRLTMETPESSLFVNGAVRQYLSAPVLSLEVRSEKFSLPEIARVVPALARVGLRPAFDVTLDGPLDRLGIDVNVRSSAGELSGTVVADLARPRQSAAGTLSIRRLDLAPILDDRRWKSDITTAVTLDVEGGSLSELEALQGTASIDAPRIVTAAVALDRVKATARLAGRRIGIEAGGSAYGASATAAGNIVLPASRSGSVDFDLRGRARNVDVRRLPDALDIPRVATNVNGDYHVTGSASMGSDAAAGSGFVRTIRADLRFQASEIAGTKIANGSTAAFALNGDVAYDADARVDDLDLQRIGREFRIQALASDRYASSMNGRLIVSGRGRTLDGTSATARGTLRDSSVLGGHIPQLVFDADLQQNTAHLRATGSFEGFDPAAASGRAAMKGSVGGMLDVEATVANVSAGIAPDSVEAIGQIQLAPSTFGGLTITRGIIDGDYRNAVADLRSFDIAGPDVSLKATGTLALDDSGQSNLELEAAASNLEAIGKMLGRPLAGIAGVKATVTGNRRELQASGTLTGGGLRYGDNGALGVTSSFTASLPDLQLENASLSATTDGTFVTLGRQEINALTAQTDYAMNRLLFTTSARQPQRTLDVAGALVTHPDHQEVHLQRLSLATQGITWQTAEGSEATIRYAPDSIEIDELLLSNGDQQISADGRFGRAGEELSVGLLNVDVGLIDALLLRPPQLSGRLNGKAIVTTRTGGRASAQGATAPRSSPRVSLDFTITNGGFRQFQYETFGGTVDYSEQTIALDTRLRQSPAAWIEAKGQVPTALFDERGWTSDAPIDLRIDSTPIDAAIVQGFTTALADVMGTFEAHVRLTGTAADPRTEGAITIHDGAFMLVPNGVLYTDLDGQIDLEPDRIHIDQIRVLDNHQSPLTIAGDLAIRERKVGEMSITMKAADFKVIDNEMGNVRLETDLQLTGQLNAPRLEGELAVTTGEINLDSILNAVGVSAYATEPLAYTTGSQGAAATPDQNPASVAIGVPGVGGFVQAMQMDVRVTVPNDLIVKANDLRAPGGTLSLGTLNVTLGGDLYVHQVPYDRIRLYGVVNTVRGTYEFQGRPFTILRDGNIRFDGLDDFEPEIDLRTERVIRAVTARVDLLGTLKRPQIVLSSVPPLEQADILSLIVFNQPINQLGEGEQLSLAERAQAMATGAVATQLARSIEKALNVDIFEVSTAPDSGADAEVTIGQQVGQNLFLKIQQGVGDQTQTNFVLEYELTDWLRLQTNVVEGSTTQQQLFQRAQGTGVNLLFFFSY